MARLKSLRLILGGGISVVLALAIAVAAMLAGPATAAPTPGAGTFTTHPVLVDPERQPAGTAENAVFTCQTDRGPDQLVCYSPQQMRQAYGITDLINAGFDGTGHTIVIIDAFQNPNMQQDLDNFDAAFGLPAADFQQFAPQGLTPFDPTDENQIGWAGEITLDVQWAHAIAPGAKIKLVLAKSNDDADILAATKWAVDHKVGDIISQSFGENESCVDPKLLRQQHQVFQQATRKGITLFASSGDQGAAELTCDGNSWTKAASSPASDPLVTAVGGTELFAAFDCSPNTTCSTVTAGTYDHEIALNEPPGFLTEGSFSSGGGFSKLYSRPDYQRGFTPRNTRGRGVPDISYSGSINHGVIASFSLGGGFFIFGGTSAGSPQWAGLTAIADQLAHTSLGEINDTLYKIASNSNLYAVSFHDITVGNNTVSEPDVDGNFVDVQGFDAVAGWDAATGLGTPKVGSLLPLLAVLGGNCNPHY